ncbi:hypothetical protein [Burkholderia sp. IMCC1007]|uniref:hypothetical protein n=1 Tax=Burkholderia sp. IMCC1007 TaxID=3004104 RepID=UPI0022B2B07B|nr:hypothetical protein [Burkholderia sp. IMCC1007]
MNENEDGGTMTAILTTRSHDARRIAQRWPIGQGSRTRMTVLPQPCDKPVMRVNDG